MSRLLIRASAGSGKTFRLSGHFLRQLFEGDPPESILATTFTRKAAGEILGRVLLRLADAADSRSGSQKLRDFLDSPRVTQASSLKLLVEVTRNLHRMRVCTLDSFFQLLARSLTLELGLPPGWGIIDEHVDQELKQQAIEAVLAQHASRDAQQLMQMLAKGRSRRSVRDLIDEAVANFYELYQLTEKEAWFRFPVYKRLRQEDLLTAIQDLQAMLPDLEKRIATAVETDLSRFQLGQWEAFSKAGLASRILAEDFTYYKKPLPAELVDAYSGLVQHARAELIEQLSRQTQATWELISRFDREYSRLRSEHGGMRFSDVTRALARSQSAEDGRRLGFRLDSTIRHLLLDEFQDTSPDQWRVLKRFALAIAGSRENTSFFCVGDGKQAIYGWRGGESQILNAVESAVPEIGTESLDTSRRSSLPVIATVNRLFQHIHQHQDLDDYGDACVAWQTAFPLHSTVHEALPGFAELRTSPFFDAEGTEQRRSDWYRWVAEQIRDLHHQAPGREIGVLTRRNATVARLVHELSLLDVAASEEGGTPPTDSPAVLAVMSLLHFCGHPACQVSRFHVSQSPLGPFTGLTDWNDDSMAVRVAASLRARLLDDGFGRTLQWLLEGVRSACNSRDLLRMQQVVAAGWQFDQAPSLNASDFVRLLENSRFVKSEPAPVRVMTVHQSKGLEFDIVVLPELDGKLFQPPPAAAGGNVAGEPPEYVSIWRTKELRSLLPVPLQQAFAQTIASDLSEALCLLYVAMTRAVYALHMLIPPVSSKRTPKTYAGLLLASLTEDGQAPGNAALYQHGEPLWFTQLPDGAVHPKAVPRPAGERHRRVQMAAMPDGRRRGLTRIAPSRHDETRLFLAPAEVASRSLRSGSRKSADPIERPDEIDARTKGTLIHAWFECITWLDPGDGCPDEERLKARATELLIPRSSVERLLPEFRAMLQRPQTRAAVCRATAGSTLADNSSVFRPLAQDIAAGRVQLRVMPERMFVLPRPGAIIQGTIDRLVLARRDGQYIAADIIDFKTDRLVGDVAAWTKEKCMYYGGQLQIYREAVQHAFGVPPHQISARLLLLEADLLVEVAQASAS